MVATGLGFCNPGPRLRDWRCSMAELHIRLSLDASGIEAALARVLALAAKASPHALAQVQPILAAIEADSGAAIRFINVSEPGEVRYLAVPSPLLAGLLNALESADV